MKKIAHYLLSIIFTLSILSCDKLLTFDYDVKSNFTIGSGTGIGLPVSFPTPAIQSSNQESFTTNNTSIELIDEATITSLSLTITSPTNQTFSFLETIDIYISADGLEDKKVATLQTVPATTSIQLTTTAERIEAYIKKDSYTIKNTVVTDEVLTQDINIEAAITINIKASPL